MKTVCHVKNGKPTGSVVDRYRYPVQEVEIGRKRRAARCRATKVIGNIVAHDRCARTIDIRKGPRHARRASDGGVPGTVISTTVQQEALLRFAEDPRRDILWHGPPLPAQAPRAASRRFAQPGEDERVTDFAVRLATSLDRTTLAIQGPPGSGKTYVGARMIRALVRAGKKVGVTAVSHKVIRNLLDAVLEQEAEEQKELEAQVSGKGNLKPVPGSANVGPGLQARPMILLGHKCDASDDADCAEASAVEEFSDNAPALAALASGEINVLGGTSWLWSRDDASATVDVLFVDEAGQMSLANTLAVSGAAQSLVLLGDPQQLEQPQKGSHPDGVGVSALEHVLGGAATMPPDRGLFLPTTWRLHPAICAFTSEVFYEGKLEPKPGLERQRLTGTGAFDGAGLWWVPVDHDGNQNVSMEEVAAVERIVKILLGKVGQGFSPAWTDEDGTSRPLLPTDLLVVAPYNAQVNRLTERLAARGVPWARWTRFQGQEAPVVIYSMATSRPEDAPRGMEFLYSLNRLNVATSRARCAVIVVASPRLLEPACRTPRQMQLANALCRYRERATELPRTNESVALIG